ncbi:MAG TPA: hypothetical protein PLO31_07960 [Dysgonamonadaceae bacterium]|jgi:hypothetical protein|nr:hypothetical protein [Paludibacteraceae bacterium]HOV72126.1 hypothetical protein [Dysgonamonadaceae bacterium]
MADLKANIAGDYFFTARFLRANIRAGTGIGHSMIHENYFSTYVGLLVTI